MVAPLGLQVHTIREYLKQDFEGTYKRVAEIGYLAVETGLDGLKQHTFLHSLGFALPSVMAGLPIKDEQRELLDIAREVGCTYITVPWLPIESFQQEETIKQLAERLDEAARLVSLHDLKLAYHNHWWEFRPTFAGGKTPHEVLRTYTSPAVFFEVDVYWAATGGADPVQVIKELGARAPLLHIKDGPAVEGVPMTAVGEGKLDIPAIIQAADGTAQWLFVELDECATDMFEATEKSYTYLTSHGLARGHR